MAAGSWRSVALWCNGEQQGNGCGRKLLPSDCWFCCKYSCISSWSRGLWLGWEESQLLSSWWCCQWCSDKNMRSVRHELPHNPGDFVLETPCFWLWFVVDGHYLWCCFTCYILENGWTCLNSKKKTDLDLKAADWLISFWPKQVIHIRSFRSVPSPPLLQALFILVSDLKWRLKPELNLTFYSVQMLLMDIIHAVL